MCVQCAFQQHIRFLYMHLPRVRVSLLTDTCHCPAPIKLQSIHICLQMEDARQTLVYKLPLSQVASEEVGVRKNARVLAGLGVYPVSTVRATPHWTPLNVKTPGMRAHVRECSCKRALMKLFSNFCTVYIFVFLLCVSLPEERVQMYTQEIVKLKMEAQSRSPEKNI